MKFAAAGEAISALVKEEGDWREKGERGILQDLVANARHQVRWLNGRAICVVAVRPARRERLGGDPKPAKAASGGGPPAFPSRRGPVLAAPSPVAESIPRKETAILATTLPTPTP